MAPPKSPPGPGIRRFLRPRGVSDTLVSVSLVSPATGRVTGGTAVTITGKNFRYETDGSAPIVLFGGDPATSVVVVNSTTITCVTPAREAELVDVIVQQGQGFVQEGILYNGFTFYQAIITAVVPSSGTLNGGQRVIVEGLNFITGMTVKFDGVAVTSGSFLDETRYSVEVPAHATGFVDVSIWDGPTLNATLRNGYQYTLFVRGQDIRRNPGITINDVLNNAPNSCRFRIDGDSAKPVTGEKIEIIDSHDGNRKLFAGTLQSFTQVYEGLTNQLAWDVTCVDFTWSMNKRRPFGTWRNVSASTVVRELIAKYAPGFTTNHVQTKLAPVTLTLDGSTDLVTVLSNIAAAIGGGHWYVDYDQDVHFFHIVPKGLSLPPTAQTALGANMTVTQAGLIPASVSFDEGFYVFQHTFVFSDGSETRLGSMSNVIRLSGVNNFSITGLPTGTDPLPLTVVARRIYYRRIIKARSGRSSLEEVFGLWQVNDNVTTSFNTTFQAGIPATDSANVGSILPTKTYAAVPGAFSPSNPTTASYVQLSDQAADQALKGNVPLGTYASNSGAFASRGWAAYNAAGVLYPAGTMPSPRAAGDIYYASNNAATNSAIATDLENRATREMTKPPNSSFNGHLPGPTTDLALSTYFETGPNFFHTVWVQTKVAYLYRDGSVSYPSAGSNFGGAQYAVKGQRVRGFSFDNIPTGPTVNGVDVVARIIYIAYGKLTDPNYSYSGPIPIGFVWPVGHANPDWTDSGGMAYIVADNTTTRVSEAEFNFTGYGSDRPYNTGIQVLSVDPIPVWPNPDGPSLEDDDPPEDIDDVNTSLLRDPQITSSIDISQIRNRVFVVGAGSATTLTANIGATSILVADITSFSPAGGTVRITDAANGRQQTLTYIGISGQVGATALELSLALVYNITQGSSVVNFFQADDLESQKFLAKVELDKNGLPTDGVHEYTVVDTSLKAVFQLYMRAYAELELFSRPIETVTYATRDPKSRSGQTVHVDLTNPPIQGDFLIQSVTIDQIHDESDELSPRYNVTASSIRYELNDLLLSLLADKGNGGSSAGVVVSSVTNAIEFVSDSAILVAQLTLTDAQFRVGGAYTIVAGQPGVMVCPISAAWHTKVLTGGASSVTGSFRHQASGGSPVAVINGTFWSSGGGVPVLRFGEAVTTGMNAQSLVDHRGLGIEVSLSAGAGVAHVSEYGFIIVLSYKVYTVPFS